MIVFREARRIDLLAGKVLCTNRVISSSQNSNAAAACDPILESLILHSSGLSGQPGRRVADGRIVRWTQDEVDCALSSSSLSV